MHPQDRLFCEIAVQLELLTHEQVQQCLHAQERDPRRNAAALAVHLGFITQANVDAVVQQQQRVLDRRREARAASRAQREAESRESAGLRPAQPPVERQSQVGAPPSDARAPRRTDPTPTTPWVHDAQARLRSERPAESLDDVELAEEHFGDLDRALSTRETLDERPPARSSARNHARELQAAGLQPSAAEPRDTIEELPPDFERADAARAGRRTSREDGARAEREDETRAGRRQPSDELRLDQARREAREPVDGEEARNEGRPSRPERDDPTRGAPLRASGRDAASGDREIAAARQQASRARAAASGERGEMAGNEAPLAERDAAGRHQAGRARESAGADREGVNADRDGLAGRHQAGRARESAGADREGVNADREPSAPRTPGRAREADREALPPGRHPQQRLRDSDPDSQAGAAAARDNAPRTPRPPAVPPAFLANDARHGMATRATVEMERVAGGPPAPPAAGRAGRTPFRAELRSPPFLAAATSAPLTGSVLSAQPVAKTPNGTLLESSGREQRLRELAERAAKPQARSVPAGRDWRNPSRPPPPMAAFDTEPAVAALDTGGGARQLRAPPLDTPRYVDRVLELCSEFGASDLQLHAGAAPCARVDGKLWPLAAEQRLTRAQAESLIGELLDDAQQLQIHVDGQLRFVYELSGGLRARGHAYLSEQGMHLALRLLPREVPPPERLGLGPALRVLREAPHGLCVCSSPAGAGRSTSLFALTRGLIAERGLHVVTIEDPIELVHGNVLGLVEQRELGRHVASFAEGIEWALRQAVDVIVISDVLAPGALEACLHACRARCLVLAGMRASNAGSALGRLIHGSPNPELTRTELAHGLRLLLQQRLVPKARVPGRVAAIEQVVNTPQIAQLIRDDKLQQLPAVMSASKSTGMSLLDDALDELVRVGTITPEVAQKMARRGERFKAAASG